MLSDLKGRSVRGGAITIASQGAYLVLQLGSTAVLARMLTPADFGLIAMATAFTGLIEMFKDGGLSMATVQRKEVDHTQISTLFWINIALALCLAASVAALAPAVAWFYGDPRLVQITLAFAGVLFVGALALQHQAIIRRQMRFKALAAVQIGSMAGGVGAAISMAMLGAGDWALLGLHGGRVVTNVALVWILCTWRPGLPRRTEGFGSILSFGGNLTGFNLINYLRPNAANVLIGAFAGANPLGLYVKAFALVRLPTKQINSPLESIVTPALSRLQDRPEQYRQYYCRALQAATYASLSMSALLIVLADQIVLTLLGRQWMEAADLFRILGLAGFIHAIVNTTGWVMISLGQTNRMFKWSLFQTSCAVTFYAVGLAWGGVRGLAVAVAIGTAVLLVPGLLYCFHYSPISMGDVCRAVRRPMTLAMGILITGGLPQLLAPTGSPWVDGVIAGGAATAFVGLALLLWRPFRDDMYRVVSFFR